MNALPPVPMAGSDKPRLRCPAHGHTASDAEDAANWRALMSSDRIRLMGRTNDMNHLGVEFWAEHPSKHPSEDCPQDNCRMQLLRYVHKIRRKT